MEMIQLHLHFCNSKKWHCCQRLVLVLEDIVIVFIILNILFIYVNIGTYFVYSHLPTNHVS